MSKAWDTGDMFVSHVYHLEGIREAGDGGPGGGKRAGTHVIELDVYDSEVSGILVFVLRYVFAVGGDKASCVGVLRERSWVEVVGETLL